MPPRSLLSRVPPRGLLLLAVLAACGKGPAPAPAPGPAGEGAPVDPRRIPWDPESLVLLSDETTPAPGSGRTWMQGIVVDTSGRPVPGAEVEVLGRPRSETWHPPIRHAVAAAGPDGRFRVGPGPTPWWNQGVLAARAPGFARTALRSRALTGPGAPAAEEGEDVRIVLRAGNVLRGEVRGEDEGGPDAPVTVVATGDHGYFESVESDALGGFTLHAPEGPVRVSILEGAHPPAFAEADVKPGAENRIRLTVRRGKDIRGRVLDQATGEPVEGAVIRAHYGRTILHRTGKDGTFLLPKFWFRAFQVRAPGYAFKIHYLTVQSGDPDFGPEVIRLAPGVVARGRAVDPDGRPAAGIRLRSFYVDAHGAWQTIAGPRTGPDGSFVFVGLPVPPGDTRSRIVGSALGWATGVSAPLPVRGPGLVEGIEIRVPRGVDLAGTLEDETGASPPGRVGVEWDRPPGAEEFGDLVPGHAVVATEPGGRWRVTVPERIEARITAIGEAFADTKLSIPVPAAGAPLPPVTIRVLRGMAIRGRVFDAAGKPVGRGEVRVEPNPPTDPRPSKDAVVEPDGTFQAGGLAEGLYDFSVLVHPEFLQEVVKEVRAGSPPVDVRLRRPGGLRLRVLLPAGAPQGRVPEVAVRGLASTLPLPAAHFARLSPDEPLLHLSPLAPGPYAVRITAGDYRKDLEVTVPDGEPAELGDVMLAPAGVVEGRVRLDGAGVSGAEVEFLRILPEGKSEAAGRGTTDAAGAYRFGGLLAGDHLAIVRAADRPILQVRFSVSVGRRELDLDLARGARATLAVKDAAGKPVPGARVLLAGTEGGIPFWRAGTRDPGPHATGEDGILQATGLPAGPLRFIVEKPGVGRGEIEATGGEGEALSLEVRLTGPM